MQSLIEAKKVAELCLDTCLFSDSSNSPKDEHEMSLLALSHTKAEHILYAAMLSETRKGKTRIGAFSVRHLMIQTGIHNHSSIRRARAGLIDKMSIERQNVVGDAPSAAVIYVVYSPKEIMARREQAGIPLYPKGLFDSPRKISTSGEIIERLVEMYNLSRRETEVAFKCAEGLTNSEIGKRLFIQEDTVKFHLRNIFIKFGVRRRTELMARIFGQENCSDPN